MERAKSNFDILQKITYERESRNWSEYTLAKNSNIAQSTISTWYRKNMEPSVTSIEKICNGLGISLSQFFSDDSDTSKFTAEQCEIFELWNVWVELKKTQFWKCCMLFLMISDSVYATPICYKKQ